MSKPDHIIELQIALVSYWLRRNHGILDVDHYNDVRFRFLQSVFWNKREWRRGIA